MDSALAAQLRREYTSRPFGFPEAGTDPIALFDRWLHEAIAAQLDEPHAVAFATADAHGDPAVRIVLLKSFDGDGAVIATNFESRKGRDVTENPRASFVTLWHPIFRQIRVSGDVMRLSDAESDAIFAARPRGSQLSAIASRQSEPIADRETLNAQVERVSRAIGAAAPARPPYWGGLRLIPERFEFWQGRQDRLHDRIVFLRDDDGWQRSRLQP